MVHSSDPGLALTTRKCADIGGITIQSMRGLAARPPYFSNGSAETLSEVVEYYDRRYDIGLTEQEIALVPAASPPVNSMLHIQ